MVEGLGLVGVLYEYYVLHDALHVVNERLNTDVW